MSNTAKSETIALLREHGILRVAAGEEESDEVSEFVFREGIEQAGRHLRDGERRN